VELKFFIGTKAIAAFLEASLDTTRKWLRKGVLPAKKDPMGRWVMTNLDYYQSLT
jgi:predicted site-specific integrase-resolvase